MDPHLITVLVLGLLAWDVLRRFAGSASQTDLDEINAYLEGLGEDATNWRKSMDSRLEGLDERVSKHGDTLTKLGLKGLGKP